VIQTELEPPGRHKSSAYIYLHVANIQERKRTGNYDISSQNHMQQILCAGGITRAFSSSSYKRSMHIILDIYTAPIQREELLAPYSSFQVVFRVRWLCGWPQPAFDP